jgi:hypothetical protein
MVAGRIGSALASAAADPRSPGSRGRKGWAGVPRQSIISGKSENTPLRAPTTVPRPIVTPGATKTSVASQASAPIETGSA